MGLGLGVVFIADALRGETVAEQRTRLYHARLLELANDVDDAVRRYSADPGDPATKGELRAAILFGIDSTNSKYGLPLVDLAGSLVPLVKRPASDEKLWRESAQRARGYVSALRIRLWTNPPRDPRVGAVAGIGLLLAGATTAFATWRRRTRRLRKEASMNFSPG